MTDLEQAKIRYAETSVTLEIAQNQHNEAKRILIAELNKAQQPQVVQPVQPTEVVEAKPE